MTNSSESNKRSLAPHTILRIGDKIKAYESVKDELEERDDVSRSRDNPYFTDAVRVGDPLHSAVVKLEWHFFEKHLPKKALRYWQEVITRSNRPDFNDEDAVIVNRKLDMLGEWVNDEILRLNNMAYPLEVTTVDDLFKAFVGGRTTAYQSNPTILERILAHCDAQGTAPTNALKKLIGLAAVLMNVERHHIRELPLTEFENILGNLQTDAEAVLKAQGRRGNSKSSPKPADELNASLPQINSDELPPTLTPTAEFILKRMYEKGITSESTRQVSTVILGEKSKRTVYKEAFAFLKRLKLIENPGRGYYITARGITYYESSPGFQKSRQSRPLK